MGRDSSLYCFTCKVEIYLGYGSYSTWHDSAKTVEELDEKIAAAGDPDVANLVKIQALRRALTEHAGHTFQTQSSDWTYTDAEGRLMGEFGPMGAGVVLIPDYADWAYRDYYSFHAGEDL